MARQSAVQVAEDSTDAQHIKWRTLIAIIEEQGWQRHW